MPEISIILPVYNVGKYVLKCLDSLLAQTFKNIEIVTVDDGSTDDSGRICDSYAKKDSRVKVLHQQNGGISAARNAGLKVSTGKWVVFVDSDDWVEPDMCEIAYRTAIETGAELVMWSYYLNTPENETRAATFKGGLHLFRGDQITYLQRLIIDTGYAEKGMISNATYVWCKMWMSDLLKGLCFDEGLSWGEDQIFNLHALGRISLAAYVDEALYHYRINEGSLTTAFRPDRPQRLLNYLISLGKYISEYRADDGTFHEAYDKRVVYTLIRAARSHFCHRENKSGLFERAKDIKNLADSEPYASSLRRVHTDGLNFRRKVFIYLAKKRLFTILLLVYKIGI